MRGFESIDSKKKCGICLSSLEGVLDFARTTVPALCQGFKRDSVEENVSELMRLTSYKPKKQFINALSCGLNTGAKDFAKHITGEGLQDFQIWLGGRGWETAGGMGVVDMVDAKGNPVPGQLIIAPSDDHGDVKTDPRRFDTPSAELVKKRELLPPMDDELLELALNPDKTIAPAAGWSSW